MSDEAATPVTLASRLGDGRTVADADLLRLTRFLVEVARGSGAEGGDEDEPGQLSSIGLSDFVIEPGGRNRAIEHIQGEPTGRDRPLIEPGEYLNLSEAAADQVSTASDERAGVLWASEVLAQVAAERSRSSDETWDDLVEVLEQEQRSGLASALWIGLAHQPEARYPSLAQWRRAVDSAIRSDAATRAELIKDDGWRLSGVHVITALALLVVGAGVIYTALTQFGSGSTATVAPSIQDGGQSGGTTIAVNEPEGPGVSDPTNGGQPEDDGADGNRADNTTDNTADNTADAKTGGSPLDRCSLVGQLGPLTVDQVTDTAIVIAWAPSSGPVNVLLDDAFLDTLPSGTFRYVIERHPLSDNPLSPDTDYTVAVEPRDGNPSSACTTTETEATPGVESIGVYSPTGLTVTDATPTSLTVAWDPRPGADSHNLFLDGAYVRFGDVGGSTTFGDEAEFTFLDLQPGTSYEIGIRRLEGTNQSGMVTITAITLSD